MVYQGTVWGPTFWNVFFQDAREAIRRCNFTEVVYADDLNAFQEYPSHTRNELIMEDLKRAQRQLHSWGSANRVAFDAGKESLHIVSRSGPFGPNFKILGVEFDPKLLMHKTVHDCARECGWKLQALLRTWR